MMAWPDDLLKKRFTGNWGNLCNEDIMGNLIPAYVRAPNNITSADPMFAAVRNLHIAYIASHSTFL